VSGCFDFRHQQNNRNPAIAGRALVQGLYPDDDQYDIIGQDQNHYNV
jgi:hypothetical protein